jgi:hypothetical protein
MYRTHLKKFGAATGLLILLAAVALAANGRTVLKPGWNMFSPKQDIEVGQQVSQDAERQLPMLDNARVDNYVNALGRRLAEKAPGEQYPYSFKVVNDKAINAFALPGGPIYINRGVIEAADNESQLAGVIAHEISHVALRHGTNQASKASAAQVPLAILGGVIGSDSTAKALAQLGASFAVNSVLLKYSRAAESQADIMGTQILYDAGYDPRAMGQFFEKIEAQQRGSGQVEFFSNHPSPDNRIERVDQEVSRARRRAARAVPTHEDFDDTKRCLQGAGRTARHDPTQGRAPPRAVRDRAADHRRVRRTTAENRSAAHQSPGQLEGLRAGRRHDHHPKRRSGQRRQRQSGLGLRVIVNVLSRNGGYGRSYRDPVTDKVPGNSATRWNNPPKLVQELRLSNRNMRVIRYREAIWVDGQRALSTYLSNDSPVGGRETDWLVTVERPDGLLFIVFTAPEREFQSYESTFHQMLRSVRINR